MLKRRKTIFMTPKVKTNEGLASISMSSFSLNGLSRIRRSRRVIWVSRAIRKIRTVLESCAAEPPIVIQSQGMAATLSNSSQRLTYSRAIYKGSNLSSPDCGSLRAMKKLSGTSTRKKASETEAKMNQNPTGATSNATYTGMAKQRKITKKKPTNCHTSRRGFSGWKTGICSMPQNVRSIRVSRGLTEGVWDMYCASVSAKVILGAS
mmetsp:Transcript_36444/g.79732  ORF Transcript_36444/g.79732 Transcript_36444/m.79732 type:complete len:207 (+) Transcript_36444:1573-2193(+)